MKTNGNVTTKRTPARKGSSKEEPDPDLSSYREHLVHASEKAQDDYDKNVLALSGGAIGVSVVFLRDIIKQSPKESHAWLLSAWVAWGLSILVVLGSYLLSKKALDTAIDQVDSQQIYKQKPGRRFSTVLSVFNILSGALFLVGIALLGFFVYTNF